MDRDRNLLFGVFAVQFKKTCAFQWVEAAGASAAVAARGRPPSLVQLEQRRVSSSRSIICGGRSYEHHLTGSRV